MASSSLARTLKKPGKYRAGWAAALVAATTAAVAGIIYAGSKSSPKVKPVPTPKPVPGPAPAGQVPVWTLLSPVASPDVPGTYMVQVPAGASFAIADSASDPALQQIINGLNQAYGNGTVTAPQFYASSASLPAGWPSDGYGPSDYRASGVATKTFNLGLGPLSWKAPTQMPEVYIVTGFTNA